MARREGKEGMVEKGYGKEIEKKGEGRDDSKMVALIRLYCTVKYSGILIEKCIFSTSRVVNAVHESRNFRNSAIF